MASSSSGWPARTWCEYRRRRCSVALAGNMAELIPAWCEATTRTSSAHAAIQRDSSTDDVARRSPRGAVMVTALVASVASNTRCSRTERASAVGSPANARSVSESSGSLVGRGGSSPSAAPSTIATSTSRPTAPARGAAVTPWPTRPCLGGVASSSASSVVRNRCRVTGGLTGSRCPSRSSAPVSAS